MKKRRKQKRGSDERVILVCVFGFNTRKKTDNKT